MRISFLLLLTASLLAASCTMTPSQDTSRSSSSIGPVGPSALSAAAVDLSGTWTWRNVEILRIPLPLATMLGLPPEGPNVMARCESAGTMTLTHTGDTFSGSATRTFNTCETSGGESFQQPGTAFQVVDGQITGRSLHFSFESATVKPCPHRAVLSTIEGSATEITGTGHCVVPGHPQSESPLPLVPPPGGTSTTVSWTATKS